MTAPFRTTRHAFLSSTEEIIDEAKNGRMFILVDDEDRENEGDLVIPAQMATPAAVNFMATHGKGLICLALAKSRTDQLGLKPMAAQNGTRHETAFTVSIEARDGVSTGISAGDRARTVAVAIDAAKGPEHIVTPGHVFPLIARPGGVLVRAGHTEAAVDVSRLAGLNPSGVICEIMKEDGSMARLDDLVAFAQLHGLKIGTIRDLIAYRRRHDHNVERVAEARFESVHGGDWTAITFRNKAIDTETIALVKGKIDPAQPTVVRMHALSIFDDALGMATDRRGLLGRAMDAIAAEGVGVLVLLQAQAKYSEITRAVGADDQGEMQGFRDYGVGAQILAELGIHDMILLTNSHHNLVALDGYGLNIVEERPLPPSAA
ncbi:3,4-dihydroxy-2-butanone-4-phosphate synthase [Sphingomonadales bacterium 56]|uniref:3,4-dihydroxy-2-butanone 4-phosphate synthase n=1 Tax=Sphingobium indicum TaxID=332055 RepID=A0A4Q4ITL4_9SPHN|nr:MULTISPECIES: 3,4-dihydroxy-2-butanone-4-phosphate synthase [Sphingobium]MBY2930695.1 3,4-dihydroxy-2-butanone-4-phosphate synthase [Sphingomonadales bacterium 56]MBY2960763.1 3,4-dihydroxy-2-butanone-4-phosphate synthase [Sphingomonadales bacterium 58]NYI24999.1 3,4-dihydroxy 2-butanone 4-phosphate synthase/GTP cyclohydrolase II [Sphingobium indicum]RYL96725.1 3,4-dihydroxy-2-butanone-4-phosphate synthase [Sphingobium indicum]CAD7341775.1 Riboflavin biosynthesis protein RibBA [Sphingobium 